MGERKMSNEDWWKPENLKSSEQAFIENESLEALDTGNDFGSYKIMRLKGDIKSSQIMSHNDLQPRYRVSAIKKILGENNYKNLLDIGCGLGYTTNELEQAFLRATVTGIDISEDAILYASQKFRQCEFRCEAIDPSNNKQIFKFDLITAFEFYPFTRTDSLKDHIAYIKHLTKELGLGGSLVIFQLWDNPKSLSVNYEALRKHFSNLDFKAYDMPIRKLGNLIHSRKLAVLLSEIIRPILRIITNRAIGRNKLIIISKR
jgi:SAM-dependent methyltransferase